jgi:hypothetical protein
MTEDGNKPKKMNSPTRQPCVSPLARLTQVAGGSEWIKEDHTKTPSHNGTETRLIVGLVALCENQKLKSGENGSEQHAPAYRRWRGSRKAWPLDDEIMMIEEQTDFG